MSRQETLLRTDFGADNGTANTIDYARSVFIRPDGTILVGGYEYTTGTDGIAFGAAVEGRQECPPHCFWDSVW